MLLGAVQTRHADRQVIGIVEVRWGKMTVRWFNGQRDEGNLSSAMSKISSPDNGLTTAPLYGLITSVPFFSSARSVSRTGERLTSNLSASSASPKWSPGLKTSSRIASRILLNTRNGGLFGLLYIVCIFRG